MLRRRPLPVLLVLLLLAGAGGVVLEKGREKRAEKAGPQVAKTVPATEGAKEREAPTGPAAAKKFLRAPKVDADPARYRRAYVLNLDGGHLSLEDMEDIEGDFAMRRRAEREWSGMFRCRLVSAEGRVLAEELISAPDRHCTVLADIAGKPTPITLSNSGPILFQLRLPLLADAARLDVARITQPNSLESDLPVGSISLVSP